MKMPRWLQIIIWISFGVSLIGVGLMLWPLNRISTPGGCLGSECLWLIDWGGRLMIGGALTACGLAVAYTVYTMLWRRAEWLEWKKTQPKMPRWYWVPYWASWAAFIPLTYYSQHHEEFRSFSSIFFSLWMLGFLVPTCLRQSQGKPYMKYWLVPLVFLTVYNLWTAVDGIGTSDLRHCLGQTYFQRVPVQSVGCEIIKAIPTPRYFAGRKCPTSDLFAGCESDYRWTFSSYNQRKAAGIVTDNAPLPWRPAGNRPVAVGSCEKVDGQMKCTTGYAIPSTK